MEMPVIASSPPVVPPGLFMGTLRELTRCLPLLPQELVQLQGRQSCTEPRWEKQCHWISSELLRLSDWGIMGSPPHFKCLLDPENRGNGQELPIWTDGLLACTYSFSSQNQQELPDTNIVPLLTPILREEVFLSTKFTQHIWEHSQCTVSSLFLAFSTWNPQHRTSPQSHPYRT